jgi:hypothetical protein
LPHGAVALPITAGGAQSGPRTITVTNGIQQLTPAMSVVANYDQYTSVDETRAMYQAAKTADTRLLVLPESVR